MLEKSFEGIPHSHGMQSKKYVSKKGGSHGPNMEYLTFIIHFCASKVPFGHGKSIFLSSFLETTCSSLKFDQLDVSGSSSEALNHGNVFGLWQETRGG